MHKLKLEFMPKATQRNFARLKDDPRLADFTLVGGTALALQIGHRISEDLDFNIFGQKLPIRAIDGLLDELAAGGATIESLITSEQKLGFKINTSENLDHYIQDYLIDGAKVTFHSRNEGDRPKVQIDFLKSTPKVVVSKGGFDVLGVDGLLVMKSIVVYDRVKSRDIYDLMVLTRDHGYTLDDIFTAIDSCQPIRHKDPEHFKSVVTGVITLNKDEEGFSSIHLNVKMDEIYKYFKKLINDYEIRLVQKLRT
ncbi:nucleotidyl transferase AbiEii/AbiGii toxin family protein [Limnohabitans sp.]|uniref:nucleotidyl transferase AbiEii/AbiGii toxin family protein n=1 Tax=Limnohabitans sp. TaxID=1907725 RepID=UPI0026322F5D|nr:nucleotidyl transferase AbiEii/AbiGii toxin family protein [Limnohabitans sp.]